MNSSFISTTEGVHIWHNDCLWCVDYNVGFLSPVCHWCQKTRSNILTISLWLVTRTPPSFFGPMVFILSTIIAYGVLITKNVTYHRYGPGVKGVLDSVLQWHVFDRGASYFLK